MDERVLYITKVVYFTVSVPVTCGVLYLNFRRWHALPLRARGRGRGGGGGEGGGGGAIIIARARGGGAGGQGVYVPPLPPHVGGISIRVLTFQSWTLRLTGTLACMYFISCMVPFVDPLREAWPYPGTLRKERLFSATSLPTSVILLLLAALSLAIDSYFTW